MRSPNLRELPRSEHVAIAEPRRADWRDDFATFDVTAAGEWEVVTNTVESAIGTPYGAAAYAVAGSVLTLNAGVAGATSLVVQSRRSFHLPARLFMVGRITQKIAGTKFMLELVDAVDGTSYARYIWDGDNSTSATTLQVACGNASGAGAVSSHTSQSSITTNNRWGIDSSQEEIWFSHGALDATGSMTIPAYRDFRLPDPNREYKVRLSWTTAAAPATNSQALIDSVSVTEYSETMVTLNAEGFSATGRSIPVFMPASPTVYTLAVATRTNVAPATLAASAMAATATTDMGSSNTPYRRASAWVKAVAKATAVAATLSVEVAFADPVLATAVPGTAATTVYTRTSGTWVASAEIGKSVTGASVPAGTYVVSNTTTALTLNQSVTGATSIQLSAPWLRVGTPVTADAAVNGVPMLFVNDIAIPAGARYIRAVVQNGDVAQPSTFEFGLGLVGAGA